MNYENSTFICDVGYRKLSLKNSIKQYEFPAIETSISHLKLPSDSAVYIDNYI